MEDNDTEDSVIVVVEQKNKLLILQRFKDDEWMPLHWAYAGGHVQKKETPYYTAKRELLEETGLKAKNVVDARHDSNDIYKKIVYCLNNKNYIKKINKIKNPYGNGDSAKKIINILKKINLNKSTQKINTY